ncbi:MAG: SDR family NAD(P)-dependent oxidoreductase [Myxococcota bacterium]
MLTAFVTGCASGFGLALARRLLARGDAVVATDEAVDPDWAAALPASDRLRTFRLDVRRDDDVRAVTEAVLRAGPVDLLVNNAGIAWFGTQEEGDVEAFRDLLDVNVLGPARVTRALLPSLRARRGTVVNLSSVAGRTVFPESGFYAATKHAVEAMSEALFQETCTFGVRVRLIEPGSFATRFLERAAAASPVPPPSSPYAPLREAWGARKGGVLEVPQDPEQVVDAIVRSLDDPAPFRRVPVGPDAERILALRDALGPDPWTRLAGDRNGLVAPHTGDEVPSAEELLALPDVDPRWALVRAAHAHGHLEHWAETEAGRRALARLAPPEPAEQA